MDFHWPLPVRESFARAHLRAVLRLCAIATLVLLALCATALPREATDQYEFHEPVPSHRLLEAPGGGRPPLCPPRRWCGCALSLRVFGQPIRPLYLAANWMRYFRRAAPGPHMVAARKGHVMQLLAHVEGARWLVYDPNSGGGLTRVHVRSISGFVVVDPWTKE